MLLPPYSTTNPHTAGSLGRLEDGRVFMLTLRVTPIRCVEHTALRRALEEVRADIQVRNSYEQMRVLAINTMSATGDFRISESAQWMVFVAICGFFGRALRQPPLEGSVNLEPPVSSADFDLETLDMELGARLESLGLPLELETELVRAVAAP